MSRESLSKRVERAGKIVDGLDRLYPDAECALLHGNAHQLLFATILSAQSTDQTVNRVSPTLFKRYRTISDFADAELDELETLVRQTGFFRQKSKNIRGSARKIMDEYGGEVPDQMESLIALPGVARKTANVVLGTWFGKSEGITVDTHVGRLAHRWKLTWRSKDSKDAAKIERDLMEVIQREDWTRFGHSAIWHGRRVCMARKPDCDNCALSPLCPSAHKV